MICLSRHLFSEIVMLEWVRFFQKKKAGDALRKLFAKYSGFCLVEFFVCIWEFFVVGGLVCFFSPPSVILTVKLIYWIFSFF